MRIRVMAMLLCGLLLAVRAEAQFRVADPAPGENYHVELGLMFWTPTPEIQIQTGGLTAAGFPEIDFVQEFALADERFTEFRAVLKPERKHKIRFSYVPFEYSEQATIQRTISFGGVQFPVSVPVTANVEWNLWRIGYEWDFVAGDRGLVGFITELKHNQLNADLSAAGVGSSATDVTAPIVAIGGIIRAYPHRNFSLTAEFTGFKLFGFVRTVAERFTDDDLEAKMYDLDLYGTVNFGRHVGVQGGYRRVTAEYLVDNDAGDLKMKGLYFGGLLRF